MVWSKVMSWMLSGNVDRELQRWDLMQKNITKRRIDQLIPPFDTSRFPTVMQDSPHDDSVPPVDDKAHTEEPIEQWLRERPHLTGDSESSAVSALHTLFQKYRVLFGPTHASNSWVVGGSMTESGAPLLCNDPHLPLSAPSLWILLHLQVITVTREQQWRREDVIGASLVGVPGILIGRNNVSSWGLTNTGADVQDLYVMEDNADHTAYLYNSTFHNYTWVTETIRRKGASDVTFKFRKSRYGPVLSDLTAYPSSAPLSLHWTSLFPNDTTINAFLGVECGHGLQLLPTSPSVLRCAFAELHLRRRAHLRLSDAGPYTHSSSLSHRAVSCTRQWWL